MKPPPPTRFPHWLSLPTSRLIASAEEYEALVEAGEVKGVALGPELTAMLALTAAELREEILRRSVELYALSMRSGILTAEDYLRAALFQARTSYPHPPNTC